MGRIVGLEFNDSDEIIVTEDVEPEAVIQYQKRNVNKAIAPEDNKDADGWQFNFREIGIADVEPEAVEKKGSK